MRYLSCAETAKLVRQALKEAFPGVKFGVRSSTYSGGMTDYKGSCYALYQGEQTRFGADFIFCERDYSDRLIDNAITALWSKNYAQLSGVDRPTPDQWRIGACNGVAWEQGRDLRDLIWRALVKRTDRFAQPSPTAMSVIYLGNDGHSQCGAVVAADVGVPA